MGVVVAVAALLTGASALTHIGPFRSAPRAAATPTSTPTSIPGALVDIRGDWKAVNAYAGGLYVATMHISTENLSSGTFSGTFSSPVGVETLTGTVTATTVSFAIGLGTSKDQGSAAVSHSGTKLLMQGTFSNPSGGHGTIFATRTSR